MTSVSRHERISGQLVDLKMPGALEALDEVIRRVDSGSLSGSEAIEQLLGAQIALRNNRRLEAAMRSSRLPAVKRLADFDFTFQPSLRREQIDSLHELDFLRRKENVVFLGPPGVGKTHLAISLAIRAAESGRRVYYGSLRDLVGSLQEAETKGQLRRRLRVLTHPALLVVVDEIGYLPVTRNGTTLFFQLINERLTAGGKTHTAFDRRSIPAQQPVVKPTRRSRARRDGGRVAPPPVPSAPGSTRCWRPAPETAGDPSRLNRVASRRSSLRFGRNTLGIPPSRALSAGRLAGLGAHVGSTTGCSPRRFAPLIVAFRSKYTRASSPGGGSSLTRLVSRTPTGRTGRSRRSRGFHHRLLRAGVHGADFEQGVRGVGDDPRGRGDGRGAAGSAAPPLPPREHPGEQLPDAAARRPGAGAPAGPSEEEPRTRAGYPSGDAPVKRHARRARISGRSAPSVRARRAHPGTHPPPPIRPQPLQIPSTHPSAGTQSPRKSGTFSKPQKWDIFEAH